MFKKKKEQELALQKGVEEQLWESPLIICSPATEARFPLPPGQVFWSTVTHNNTNESHKHELEQRKSGKERAHLYDSIYVNFQTRQNQSMVTGVLEGFALVLSSPRMSGSFF